MPSTLTAITRDIGEPLESCELTHIPRARIDQDLARAQHLRYREALMRLGADLINLPPLKGHPDAVFVEDAALMLDEIAVLTRPGAESRRAETEALRGVLSDFRPVREVETGTLDGGDVLRIGRDLYVGLSSRTNQAGIDCLRAIVEPFGYRVLTAPVRGCLHLKTGCTFLGDGTIILNESWIDDSLFDQFDLIRVPADEPWAANTLSIGGKVLMTSGNPKSRLLIEARGFMVEEIEIGELQKAEAGLTCLSILGAQASVPV
ncbi:MAG: dimethylarginine dimethylaminohydrolase family protein [Blastocatellales bacterium]